MKKVFCLIIALSLVFGAISPVFAATDSIVVRFDGANGQFITGFSAMSSIISYLTNIYTDFVTFTTGNVSNTTPSTIYKFQDLYLTLAHLSDWLVPDSARGSNDSTVWELLIDIGTACYQYLPSIPTISSSVVAWATSNNSYLGSLNTSLSNVLKDASSLTVGQVKDISHRALVDTNTATYTWKFLQSDGSLVTSNYSWTAGTPLGNLALMLQKFNENFSTFGNYYIATFVPHLLTHYADTLTTWEHSSNTQTSFVPESLTQGLYRYLAYIQSDTADLSYWNKWALNRFIPSLNDDGSERWTNANRRNNSHYNLINNNGIYSLYGFTNAGYEREASLINWSDGTPLGNLAYINQFNGTYTNRLLSKGVAGYLNPQRYLDWSTLNTASSYTPVSSTDGIYYWLKNIQIPLARLSFVLSNDEEIAARNAAKDDQNSVVNNFVASTGQATATPSDYAGVSNASASFKQNFNTGVASSGIWDTFSNTHYTWFTQDTANALDTVSASTRGAYDTPLLDNYYHEILGYFGNNRRNEDTAYDYVGNYIEQFNAERAESESDER